MILATVIDGELDAARARETIVLGGCAPRAALKPALKPSAKPSAGENASDESR